MRIKKDDFIKMLDEIPGDSFQLYVYDSEYEDMGFEIGSARVVEVEGDYINLSVNG